MALEPYKALADLAARSRKSAKGLPQKIETVPRWRGLGFSCMGERFVAPMGQVTEMLEVPAYTRLPGVQPWVIGLANVRGRLLPLLDLAMFFGGQLGQQKRNRRVLVVETDELFSGLVIERAMGMQQFDVTTQQVPSESVLDTIRCHLSGAYTDVSSQTWNIFDFHSLASDQRFANASLV